MKVGSCVSHFNVSLIVWAKSQDSVRKPQFFRRRERRAEADRTEVPLLTSLAPYRSATSATEEEETFGFTSTKTIKAYQGRGSWGSGNLYLTPTRYTVTTRMILH